MKKPYIYQTASKQAADSQKNNVAPWLPVLCVLAALGVVLSATLLGSSLGRFSEPEAYAIPLVPDVVEADATEASNASATAPSAPVAQGSAAGQDASQLGGANTDSALTPSASAADVAVNSARSTGESAAPSSPDPGNPAPSSSDPSNPDAAAQPGSMQVYGTPQAWSTETQVDLFQGSYNGTVVSADGDKLIAPGASSRYDFTLRNNAEVPLDYIVSLKVEAWSAGTAGDATISASKAEATAATTSAEDASATAAVPLEWRLLSAAGSPVSDWQPHGESERVLDSATLDVGRQAGYTIEWRWAYEQAGADVADAGAAVADTTADAASEGVAEGAPTADASAHATDVGAATNATAGTTAAADAADTARGDHAALEDFGVKATVFVRAEQAPDAPAAETPKTPQEIIAGLLAQTGDATLALAAVCALVAAACALLVVVLARRRREKDADHARG